MNRFVPILIVIAVSAFGTGQLCLAQVQIIDGDGKQVSPNEVPTEQAEITPTDQAPEIGPQIFGGNGSSIIIRKSFRSVDENGDLKTESSGKAIVIGPDGKRQEFDLNDGENQPLNFGGIRIDGLVPGPAAKGQAESFSLGLKCNPVHPAVASQLNLETGLMVSQVPPGSPAATAGVQQYDVLLYADDKQLNSKVDLSQAVKAAGEADANISLTLIRGGKEMTFAVKPEKRLVGRNNPNPVKRMPKLNLPDLGANEMFGDMFGEAIEARMRQRMEEMQERVRRLEGQLGNGMIEIE